jgi:hypothetical protein
MAARLGISASVASQSGLPLPHPSFTPLNDRAEAFGIVRKMLMAGGLGKIERLWNGQDPGINAYDGYSVREIRRR